MPWQVSQQLGLRPPQALFRSEICKKVVAQQFLWMPGCKESTQDRSSLKLTSVRGPDENQEPNSLSSKLLCVQRRLSLDSQTGHVAEVPFRCPRSLLSCSVSGGQDIDSVVVKIRLWPSFSRPRSHARLFRLPKLASLRCFEPSPSSTLTKARSTSPASFTFGRPGLAK